MKISLPSVSDFFPFWDKLSDEYRDDMQKNSQPRVFHKGENILPFKDECLGLILVQTGQLRAFILSDTGKEITLYRLFGFDICLFSASCIMINIQFDIHLEAEEETKVLMMPAVLYERLMNQSIQISNFTNELMSGRFSEVMWKLEQILFKSMDSRIAHNLLEQSNISGNTDLSITHDAIAKELCTAREVVTRMLKHFSEDGLLALSRGQICLLDIKRLEQIAG